MAVHVQLTVAHAGSPGAPADLPSRNEVVVKRSVRTTDHATNQVEVRERGGARAGDAGDLCRAPNSTAWTAVTIRADGMGCMAAVGRPAGAARCGASAGVWHVSPKVTPDTAIGVTGGGTGVLGLGPLEPAIARHWGAAEILTLAGRRYSLPNIEVHGEGQDHPVIHDIAFAIRFDWSAKGQTQTTQAGLRWSASPLAADFHS